MRSRTYLLVILSIVSFIIFCCDVCIASLMHFGPFGPPEDDFVRVRSVNDPSIPKNKIAVLDFIGLVEQHGYPAEEHELTTSDGYILKIHRIPGSPSSPKKPKKPVVLVQHGIICSSDVFVISEPRNGLVYILADMGYDVWIGNVRGNPYGKSHVNLSSDNDPEFWNFSFSEMSKFDIRNTIDYILHETEEDSLIFISHSLGAAIVHALLASKPEYNKKIRLSIGMAPASSFTRRSPRWLQILSEHEEFVFPFLESHGLYEVFPQSSINVLTAKWCKTDLFRQLCLNLFFEICGGNEDQLSFDMFLSFLRHAPAGSSAKMFRHGVQSILSGEFKEFDYGIKGNYAKFNQSTPPRYNMSNIVTPVALFYSSGDATTLTENLPDLLNELPNVVFVETIQNKGFGHMDFIIGVDAKKLVYDKMIELIEMYRT